VRRGEENARILIHKLLLKSLSYAFVAMIYTSLILKFYILKGAI